VVRLFVDGRLETVLFILLTPHPNLGNVLVYKIPAWPPVLLFFFRVLTFVLSPVPCWVNFYVLEYVDELVEVPDLSLLALFFQLSIQFLLYLVPLVLRGFLVVLLI